ncbi:acetoin utilization protein AcuC [Microlunatus panaciterrae]|uniref:Acetoin utilization protein AcuC n=1 Tax=Microlunatus panaciterrae TaxID=400768 RepID=A0ABS2RHB5_9ACTN|nr:acetoin utilization protein AcuC [Microlunatus panaciterrae]MBM7798396.1 acetoin utilization protein AcuC [Microlunatus panaciterrae]
MLYSDELTRYDFGPLHPMAPGRVRNTIALARALGVLDRMEVVAPPEVDLGLIRTVHDADYVEAVQKAEVNPVFGLGTSDNPVFAQMHEISAQVVMATVAAAQSVWNGTTKRACNISGGLHHAMPRNTSGFCVYNDIAVAIKWLLAQGCERVAYVDVDVHHGDGVQAIFYNDPRVMTISLHETPMTLFPGTGFPHETGGPDAIGSAVNVALPPGTGDAGWLRAFHAVVPEVLHAFRPTVLVTQHGCDSHFSDPLAELNLTIDGQRASYLAMAALADELCEGRWISTGGGGYSVLNVVPRAWTHLLGVVSGHPVDPDTVIPEAWRDTIGDEAPTVMTDHADVSFPDVSSGYNPADRLDQAIIATRKAVFPELGLDPEFY